MHTVHIERPLARTPRAPGPVLLLAAAIVATLLGACTADLSSSSTVDERGPEAFKPLFGSFDKVGYRWDWSGFPTPSRGQRVQFITAWPDAVVTQDTANKITVIEPGSGRNRWAGEVATPLNRFVGVSRAREMGADRLICSSEAEVFILDMATGNLVARQRYDKVVNTTPLILGTIGVYGTPTGELLGHNFNNGVKAWGFQAPGAIEYPPILVDGVVAGISQAGYVSTIDASSGVLVGRNKIYAGSAGKLTTDGSIFFVASQDQSLYAFATSAQKIWQHRTSRPLAYAPVCVGARLYCHTADDGLTCFDAATGKVLWSNKDVSGSVVGVHKGDLIVWNGTQLAVLEPDHGAAVEQVTLPGITDVTFDRFDGGVLYVLNRAGVIGRFIPKD